MSDVARRTLREGLDLERVRFVVEAVSLGWSVAPAERSLEFTAS